jgi:hypothetical protein
VESKHRKFWKCPNGVPRLQGGASESGFRQKDINKKKPAQENDPAQAFLFRKYYSTIASVGQTDAQVPQPVQVLSSISNLPSPSLMASTGHSSAQVPQETQSSVILYAMASLLVKFRVSLFLSAQTAHRTFLYIRR